MPDVELPSTCRADYDFDCVRSSELTVFGLISEFRALPLNFLSTRQLTLVGIIVAVSLHPQKPPQQ